MTVAPAVDQAQNGPENLLATCVSAGLGNTCTQVCMATFTGQHPAIKDVFPYERIDVLIAQQRTNVSGKTAPPQAPKPIMFAYAPDPYRLNMGVTTATAEVTPRAIEQPPIDGYGESGLPLAYCSGFRAGKTTGSCSTSPDYALAYILAYEPSSVDAPPFMPQCAPWTALFLVRVWHATTAILGPAYGDGQTATPGRNFPIPLSLKATDSTGSQRAADALPVSFNITAGDATFDRSGVTTRFCTITQNGQQADVISQHGLAIAPPIKAGSAVAPIEVLATSRFAGNSVPYTLNMIERN
jgi:hypothetical protein